MISKKCISAEKLIQYRNGELSEKEINNLTGHLSTCELCRDNLQILDKIDKIISEKGKTIKHRNKYLEKSAACLSEHLLYNYIEGNVTKAEARKIEKHLNSCKFCLTEMASLARNSLIPLTKKETKAIKELRTIGIEEQVDKILSYHKQLNRAVGEASVERSVSWISVLWKELKVTVSVINPFNKRWRYAIAIPALLVLFFVMGQPQYTKWRSNKLVSQSINYLSDSYTISSRELPRPSGGFNYSEFGATRDENKTKTYEAVETSLDRALQLNPKNLLAHQYMGTYNLLIVKDLDKAIANYEAALSQDSTNASVFNDLGVFAFYNSNYDEAAQNFSKALKYDPHLLEAQYNLATTYQIQGREKTAKQEWQNYLNLDSVSIWADIARDRLTRLQ